MPRIVKLHQRSGLTIVEILVTIAIIGLLLAVLVPAVQQVRESSRVLECRNRQRQIILATLNYTEMHRVLPKLKGQLPACPHSCLQINHGMTAAGGQLGWATAIFPHLEQPEVSQVVCSGVTQLPVFQCPSDSDVTDYVYSLSYAANGGVPNSGYRYQAPFQDTSPSGNHLSDMTDGTSQTIAFSEIVTYVAGDSEVQAERRPSRNIWTVKLRRLPATPSDQDRQEQTEESLESCSDGVGLTFNAIGSGFSAMWVISPSATYSHLFPVNSRTCHGVSPALSAGFLDFINRGASSMHHRGVNAAFMDGHCRFISQDVSTEVWRAIGSQNGNEVVGDY